MMTVEEWEDMFQDLLSTHDIGKLCRHWHSGQWSGFYKLQCYGRILDSDHASDVHSDCCHAMSDIYYSHDDWEALDELRTLTDNYPCEDSDDDSTDDT